MKITFLVLAAPVWSHQDDTTLLSVRLNVHSTLESGVDQLLDVAGSRNVTLMSDLLQNLVEETISEDSADPYEIFAKTDHDGSSIRQALDMIKDVLLGDIRGALKDAHCQDQKELHQQMLCFEGCEEVKEKCKKVDPEKPTVGCKVEYPYCDGTAHKECRDDLLLLYKDHIMACQDLDHYVATALTCPQGRSKECHLPHTTFNCQECTSEIERHAEGLKDGFGTWIQKQITIYEQVYKGWDQLQQACTQSFRKYTEKDAACDCKQAECEQANCLAEECQGDCCESYDKCWERCEKEKEENDKTKECLERDRKIDWSATEKIECFINVLVEKPDNETLLRTCGSQDCYNEYRREMYERCDDICVEVDFDGVWGNHARRNKVEGSTSGHLTTVVNQSTHRHQDIDVTDEGKQSVRTRHRHATDAAKENRCTSHLDLDYQVPPCCQPCEARAHPPCVGKQDNGDYSGSQNQESYMWKHYGQYGFLSSAPIDNGNFDYDTCHSGEHTKVYAYNLCDCTECDAETPEPKACIQDKACKSGGYDYKVHYPPYYCGEPPSNCKIPGYSESCHFWGDPHFTHLFNTKGYVEQNMVTAVQRAKTNEDAMTGHDEQLDFFNPKGVFQLAATLDKRDGDSHHFEAQAFFCGYAHETTTGAGLAMKIGNDVIQIVRGQQTAGTFKKDSSGKKQPDYWADLRDETRDKNKEKDFTEFYVNGARVSWNELGQATWGDAPSWLARTERRKGNTRGDQVHKREREARKNLDQGKRDFGGLKAESSYLKQMSVVADEFDSHEDTILPTCAGDNRDILVEVGIPFLRGSDIWPMVYEQAVTIRANSQRINRTYGICTGDPESMIEDGAETYRVDRKKNLFSSAQMQSLCTMCGLELNDHECGAPAHVTSAEQVCKATGVTLSDAKKKCENFDEDKDHGWFQICVLEVCASGDSARTIAKIEEHVQLQLEEEERRKIISSPEKLKAHNKAKCQEACVEYWGDVETCNKEDMEDFIKGSKDDGSDMDHCLEHVPADDED